MVSIQDPVNGSCSRVAGGHTAGSGCGRQQPPAPVSPLLIQQVPVLTCKDLVGSYALRRDGQQQAMVHQQDQRGLALAEASPDLEEPEEAISQFIEDRSHIGCSQIGCFDGGQLQGGREEEQVDEGLTARSTEMTARTELTGRSRWSEDQPMHSPRHTPMHSPRSTLR